MAHLITKQDNAFFLKAPAWHRLGIVKDTAITKYDLTNEFGWPVFKEQLFTARGEATTTYATIRPIYNPDGTLKERIILGDKLSEDYQVLQNGELINMIDPLLEAGCFVQTGGTLNQRRRIWVLLDLPSDLQVGNEVIKRYILLSNDHTGKESARVGFVPVRVVCANTLSMAENGGHSLIKILHKGDVAKSMEAVIKLIDTANGQFLAYGEQLEALMDMPIDQDTLNAYVKTVFLPRSKAETTEEEDSEANRLKKLQNTINEIFQTEPSIVESSGANGTMYGAYQAVNHYLNHVQAIGDSRRLHSIGWGTGRQTDLRALAAATQLVSA